MIQTLRYGALAALAFALFVLWGAILSAHGYIAPAVTLGWGDVILLNDGIGHLGDLAIAHPPAALLVDVVFGALLHPLTLWPPPLVTGALLVALLAAAWSCDFDRAGYGAWSPALALLLAIHPFVLYAATSGTYDALLMVTTYWLARSFVTSRTSGMVSSTMSVGIALAIIVFVHPSGLLLCLGTLPLLGFVMPRALTTRARANLLLVLLFPLLIGMASAIYVNHLFTSGIGSPASPLDSGILFDSAHYMIEPTDAVFAGFGRSALMLAAGMPAALCVFWLRGRGMARHAPLGALICIALVAVGLDLFWHLRHSDAAQPFDTIAPFAAINAVALGCWSPQTRRGPLAALLLLASVAAGWAVLGSSASGESARWRNAISTHVTDDSRTAGAVAVGRYLAGRNDVLIDIHANATVLPGRRSAHGLIGPGDDTFDLALLTRRIDTTYIAIPDPDAAGTYHDQLDQTFPTLYREGWPGYQLVYNASGWRVYERNDAQNRH